VEPDLQAGPTTSSLYLSYDGHSLPAGQTAIAEEDAERGFQDSWFAERAAPFLLCIFG